MREYKIMGLAGTGLIGTGMLALDIGAHAAGGVAVFTGGVVVLAAIVGALWKDRT